MQARFTSLTAQVFHHVEVAFMLCNSHRCMHLVWHNFMLLGYVLYDFILYGSQLLLLYLHRCSCTLLLYWHFHMFVFLYVIPPSRFPSSLFHRSNLCSFILFFHEASECWLAKVVTLLRYLLFARCAIIVLLELCRSRLGPPLYLVSLKFPQFFHINFDEESRIGI